MTKTRQNSNGIESAYLITGEIDLRRQAEIDNILGKLTAGAPDGLDTEKYDGNSTTAESIITAAATVSMFSERKAVIVDRVDRLSPADQVKLADFIPKLGPRACLILLSEDEGSQSGRKTSVSADDDTESKKQKKGLQSDLVKSVKSHGAVVTFGKIKADALKAHIAKALQDRGKKIEPRALEAMTRWLSVTPSIVVSEVEKLVAYVGDKEAVTFNDVDEVVTQSAEDKVFNMIDAIALGRESLAVELLNKTFAASAKPEYEVPRILALIGKHFRMLYQTKFLRTKGIRSLASAPEELEAMLMQDRRQNPIHGAYWQQDKLLQQSNSFSIEDLRDCLRRILQCELTVKGLGKCENSPRLNLEMLVIELCQRKKPSRGERIGRSGYSRINN